MPVVDTNLLVGSCPFRKIPAEPGDLERLRRSASLTRGVATGFRSLLYYDPLAALVEDLTAYEAQADWLHFYAVINPAFPGLERQVTQAGAHRQVAGVRLFPTLHHYDLDAERTYRALELAAARQLPVNLTARIFDGRVAPRYVRQAEVDTASLRRFLEQAAGTGGPVILSMFFFSELRALEVDWEQLPNVYLDLGCSKPNVASLDELPSWFPTERVVFGSGAPFYYWQGSRLGLESSRLATRQQQAILGANAMKVFGWTW
mgnify:CR=1 FL=1